MSETLEQELSGVSETLLITLYLRAMESQRPDALIRDERAVALIKKISDDGLYDFSRMRHRVVISLSVRCSISRGWMP